MKEQTINNTKHIFTDNLRYNISDNILLVKGDFRFMNITSKSSYKGVEGKYRAEIIIPQSKEDEEFLIKVTEMLLADSKGAKANNIAKKIVGDKRKSFVYNPDLDDIDIDDLDEKQQKYRTQIEGKFLIRGTTQNKVKLFLDRRSEGKQVCTLTEEQYTNLVGKWDGYGSYGSMAISPFVYENNVFAYLQSVTLININKSNESKYYDPETGEEIIPVPYESEINLENQTDDDDSIPF